MRTLPVIRRAFLLAAAGAPGLLAFAGPVAAQAVPAPDGGHAQGHDEPRPSVRAVERTGPIVLDGRLDEEVWRTAPAATDFLQQEPAEGRPATQRTEVRFVFDADALYIGARMYDTEGAAGVRTRLVRRDQEMESDNLQLVFDTFHDHAGRTIFRVNPSGVKYDAGQATPSADPSWDPVWTAATQIDSLGWTAELRIPFSQLRFPREREQTWGLQIWRGVHRLNELSMWAFWGRNESGGPARFGHLEGLRMAGRPMGVEVLPYLVTRASYLQPVQPGSPFESPSSYTLRAGADVKMLLTSNLTLDATINPDFGQVEVDPAVVNLSAFETFFPERRPFFIEGSGLFGFGGLNCYFCSNVAGMSLFYSRRIGRRPQGQMGFATRYADIPENTAILGAAKVTGRTAGGVQVGLMNATTRGEHARFVTPDGSEVEREVEPLANYFVGRTRRSFRGGNTTVGAMATSVVRGFGYDSLALQLPRHAEALGADWDVFWKGRTYHLMGNLAVSNVAGEPAAIDRLQRSSARYFQRPDRVHGDNAIFSDRYDPAATALRGYGGYARLARISGALLWETAVNYRSPGFEVNDLAFLTRADYVWMNANLFRQWTTPTRHYRRLELMAGGQQQYNYDGDVTDRQAQVLAGVQLPNYWYVNSFVIRRFAVDDDRLTRGGPVVRRAGDVSWFANLSSDSRRAVVVGTNPTLGRSDEGVTFYSANLDVRFKPRSNISLSVGPSYSRSGSRTQFVRSFSDTTATHFYGRRVVFADLAQHTLSMNTRASVTFTPNLTLELFAQPFLASGDYSEFKQFDAPRARAKTPFGAAQLRAVRGASGRDSLYVLTPTGDAAAARFEFANPDFNLRSLRGNAVLRWEYRPGSTLFLVWQQQRSGADVLGDFELSRDAGELFRARPDNVFLVKASYWLGR
jgi:hypothetical protein